MSGRTAGAVFNLVLGLGALALGAWFYVDEENILFTGVLGVLGLALVVSAIVMLAKRTPSPQVVSQAPEPAPPQVVEVKRTEMNWGSQGGPEVPDDLQSQLDDVDQRMGRLKVQLGLGQVSNESFKRQMAELEDEKAGVEDAIRRRPTT